jgi:hypothetical protein
MWMKGDQILWPTFLQSLVVRKKITVLLFWSMHFFEIMVTSSHTSQWWWDNILLVTCKPDKQDLYKTLLPYIKHVPKPYLNIAIVFDEYWSNVKHSLAFKTPFILNWINSAVRRPRDQTHNTWLWNINKHFAHLTVPLKSHTYFLLSVLPKDLQRGREYNLTGFLRRSINQCYGNKRIIHIHFGTYYSEKCKIVRLTFTETRKLVTNSYEYKIIH